MQNISGIYDFELREECRGKRRSIKSRVMTDPKRKLGVTMHFSEIIDVQYDQKIDKEFKWMGISSYRAGLALNIGWNCDRCFLYHGGFQTSVQNSTTCYLNIYCIYKLVSILIKLLAINFKSLP